MRRDAADVPWTGILTIYAKTRFENSEALGESLAVEVLQCRPPDARCVELALPRALAIATWRHEQARVCSMFDIVTAQFWARADVALSTERADFTTFRIWSRRQMGHRAIQ